MVEIKFNKLTLPVIIAPMREWFNHGFEFGTFWWKDKVLL